jgi:hypothetical protein
MAREDLILSSLSQALSEITALEEQIAKRQRKPYQRLKVLVDEAILAPSARRSVLCKASRLLRIAINQAPCTTYGVH